MKFTAFFLVVGFSISATALADPDPSKLPLPSTKPEVTYAGDVRPLFEVSCFRCHGEEKQKGDLRLDSLDVIP